MYFTNVLFVIQVYLVLLSVESIYFLDVFLCDVDISFDKFVYFAIVLHL